MGTAQEDFEADQKKAREQVDEKEAVDLAAMRSVIKANESAHESYLSTIEANAAISKEAVRRSDAMERIAKAPESIAWRFAEIAKSIETIVDLVKKAASRDGL
jgi:hypothetical protein